ncbi:MAG: ChaN family lipoprotein [Balneolaceae bacterium]|nr:ChaN family lipoprotein [Balneolaceae bacterium]MCH8548867.1 ChaN family lipoprotein [Balneolaceae bacterium]
MIRNSILTALLSLVLAVAVFADKPAYLLYNAEGEQVSYSEFLEMASAHEIILFGELHNSAIAHWLQLELIRDLHQVDGSKELVVGMEMFERDQQTLIDEYFAGLISRDRFEDEARLWNNYRTDYRPVLEFAKENDLQLAATNIPRRYASAVYGRGLAVLDELSAEAKSWVAPLPIEVDTDLPGYRDIHEAAHGHGGDNLIYSQAVKDATMAHSILEFMDVDKQFVHLNGSYHSNNREGIVWYLRHYESEASIFTINTITAEDPESADPEELKAADITIVVHERMTTTF